MKSKKCSPCTEGRYREFPDLLFGLSEDNRTYFDAGRFISKYGDTQKHNVREFDIGFYHWKTAVSKCYGIPFEDLIIREEGSGRILIHESLDLLFMAYVDSGFGIYLLEKLSEMLINGIVFSDNYLMMLVCGRFSKEDIIHIINRDEKERL
ncbi:hypothetical protein IR083_07595 [Dysgonomonas sp. GY75]|uniref:hypothetical protein n=1 Tax=Dysgonomonas sp. GY75 TaxID=2780419 RepID=UPI001883AB22|nr:hypothetical protein [Dysgonomonas sp. GY75]MBF0648680.1 hypothetical protein [Dysgonomonas sp. GY75]